MFVEATELFGGLGRELLDELLVFDRFGAGDELMLFEFAFWEFEATEFEAG